MAEQEQHEKQAWEGEMFRLMVENVLDYALFIVSPDRHVLSWSKGAERLLGFTEAEIVGRRCDVFFTPEDVQDGVPQKELDEALATGRGGDDRWHVRKDGSRFWSSGMVTPLRGEGGVLRGFVKIMRDRTELKRAQEARDDALAYADAIVQTVREPLVVLDGELRVRTANRSFYRTFGVRPQETEGRLLYDLGNGQWDIPALRKLLGEILPQNTAFEDFEVEHDFPDIGRKVMLLNARKVFREGNHTELILLAIEDVTALREAERARREAETRFTEMVKNVRDHSIFLTDPNGVITSWNVAAERIIGYTQAEAVGRHFSLIFTLEDVASGVPQRELRQAREEGRAEDERWHRRKDGTPFWALGIVTPLHDPQGWLSGFSKILRDMTAWKRAEEQLAASRARLQALFDNTLDAILLADDQARLVDANPAACTLLGYSREELLRRGVFDITPPPDAEAGRAAWSAFVREGHQSGEYALCRPDGSTAVVEYRAVANVLPGLHLSVLRDVSERRRAEEALRAERGRLADLFQQAPSFMCVLRGPDHVFERANDRYLQLVGDRDLLGRAVRDAFPEVEGQGFFELLDRVYRTGEPVAASDMRLLLVGRPGQPPEERFLDFVYQPIRDPGGTVTGVFVQGVDLTDHKRAEAELVRLHAESDRMRRLYETALSNSPDFNFTFDLGGRFTYANEALLDLWGRPADEALGKTPVELGYPPELADRLLRQVWQVVQTRQPVRDETPFGSRFGPRQYEYSLVPVLGAGGAAEAVVGSAHDITDRKALEGRLRDADRRKDEFLATLAHELRNPLAPLRNGLQLLRLGGEDRATAGQALGMMERQLQQMVRLIDDLLDVSRITRGKLQLRKERVELAGVVRTAVETARPLVEASAHRLTVSLPPGPVYLDADPTRLAQVLGNLLTNAAKYTGRGGDIRLTAERHGGEVVVSVRDNGIGIPAEHLPRLFEMFSQVESALERSQGGLGIGLSLVRGLAEMHGGSVEARSEGPGKGSEFLVRLPAAGGTAPDAGDAAGETQTPRRARRILVADDNRDAADSLAMMLRLGGHEVHAARDGQEAVEAAAWFRPAVALLDIGMPRLNGYEAARRIREQPWGMGVVLVALTGWGQDEDRRKSKEAGFDHHLMKPVDPAALERLLASLR